MGHYIEPGSEGVEPGPEGVQELAPAILEFLPEMQIAQKVMLVEDKGENRTTQ